MIEWVAVDPNRIDADLLNEAMGRYDYTRLILQRPWYVESVAFRISDWVSHVYRLIEMQPGYSSEHADIEGVVLAYRQEEEIPSYVTKSGADLDAWSTMLPTLKWFSRLLRMRVHVTNPHGHTERMGDEPGVFYIHFWSVPRASASYTYTDPMWGVALRSSQRDGYRPTGDSVQILSPEGQVVAELYENNLYVLMDLPHYTEHVTLVLEGIITEVMRHIGNDGIDWEERQREIQRKIAEESPVRYADICMGRLEKALHEAEVTVQINREREQSMESEFRALIQARAQAERTLENLKRQESDRQRFIDEFSRLKAMDGVRDVVVTVGEIRVYTEHLFTYPLSGGKVYDLGEYVIAMPTSSGDRAGVRIENKTRTINYRPHPHCNEEGHVCFGNIGPDVSRLLAMYEYYPATQLIMELLRTPNETDAWGVRIHDWPVKGSPTVATPQPVNDVPF